MMMMIDYFMASKFLSGIGEDLNSEDVYSPDVTVIKDNADGAADETTLNRIESRRCQRGRDKERR